MAELEFGGHIMHPVGEHKYTFIFLHDVGSTPIEAAETIFSGESLDDLTLDKALLNLRWVFPEARRLLHSDKPSDWLKLYDEQGQPEDEIVQLVGLRQSVADIRALIDHEMTLVPSHRIILGGIGLGCAIAIHTLLSRGLQLGAFVGYAGWLPLEQTLLNACHHTIAGEYEACVLDFVWGPVADDAQPMDPDWYIWKRGRATKTPVFLAHCVDDDIVAVQNGIASAGFSSALPSARSLRFIVREGIWWRSR